MFCLGNLCCNFKNHFTHTLKSVQRRRPPEITCVMKEEDEPSVLVKCCAAEQGWGMRVPFLSKLPSCVHSDAGISTALGSAGQQQNTVVGNGVLRVLAGGVHLYIFTSGLASVRCNNGFMSPLDIDS